MNFLKESLLALGIGLCVVGIMANVSPSKVSFASEGMAEAQDVRTLDRRISLLEQRLFSIESSINRLQQSTVSQRPAPQPNDLEINQIRAEIQALQLRLNEIECGMLKLDERTANRKSGGAKPTDPCRRDPDGPLRLSTRP